jgi:hypothetical protein
MIDVILFMIGSALRAPASDRCRRCSNPKRLQFNVPTIAAHKPAARAAERFPNNRRRVRQAPRTLSIAFPNSRSRTPPVPAAGIRADARAYTPARDGGLREKACSTAFPGQRAKTEPSRLCETSGCGDHNRRAPQRAAPRSGRRSGPILRGPAVAYSARG